MNNLKFPLILVPLLVIAPVILKSQIVEITFGEVPREDVEMTSYPDDPGADAVYLNDYGQITLSSVQNLSMIVERHMRIKIINSNGFDYGDYKIFCRNGDKVKNLQAATYNIENGNIVSSKLDKKSIYEAKSGQTRKTISFTLPDVRVGSVIEIKYTFESENYFSLYPWEIQHTTPVRYGGLKVSIPNYFDFKIVPRGNFEKVRYKRDRDRVDFGSRFTDGITTQWSYSKIPAYREEPYSTGSDDYLASVGFELSKIDIPGYYFQDVSPTYSNLSKKILDWEDFGGVLRQSRIVGKKARELTSCAKNEKEKLRIIYEYVSENFVWNGLNDFTASESLARIVKKERGNSADINLLLICMLREAGLSANPIIMSTRENGELNMFFAVLQKFDNVVASVAADGERFVVDATDPLRPFDLLPFECLNGSGWTIKENSPGWVKLTNGEANKKSVYLNLQLSDAGIFSGNAQASYKDYEAYEVRHSIKIQGREGYTEGIKYRFGNWSFKEFNWKNLDSLESPVIEQYDLIIDDAVEKCGSEMAFKPILTNTYEANPFYTEERLTPVDFGCPVENSFTARIIIPSGYQIDELPSSIRLTLPDNGGQYTYNVTSDEKTILVQTKMEIKSTNFQPENYNLLREFFTRIILKEEELIILSKIV